MKKALFCALLIVAISVPSAFSQLRLEVGANVPFMVSSISGGDLGDIISLDLSKSVVVVPNLGLFLQADGGFIKLGVGAKVQSLFLMAFAGYPAAQLELALGNLCIDASLGGYYYGFYTITGASAFQQLNYLIPEVSVWLGLGKKNAFRIGAGAMGLMPSNFDVSEIPFAAYAGAKIVLQ